MKILLFQLFTTFGLAEICSDFDCFNDQLAKLNEKVENLESENLEKANTIIKMDNKITNLENDVLELEKIVRPGKIPASCEEYFNRGTIENGKYKIKPNTEINPFFVDCDFRDLFSKKSLIFIRKIIFKTSKKW